MRVLPDKLVAIVTVLCMVTGLTVAHLAVMSVDLGSEYMKIAIVKPGVPMEVITNEDSARKTATMVAIKDGERMFGNPAENSATKHPSTAFWYLTQIVGKKFEDPAVALYQKRFPFYNLIKDEERGTVLFKIDDETSHSPEELLAMILEKARKFAETFADQSLKDVVITVPSFFNQAERRSIMLAADMSGLNVLQLMGDNAAVALNYGIFRRSQFNSSMTYIMFYDMGATSTTATIVGYQVVKMKEGTRMVENPQLVIKGVGFDRELGGLELSMRLRDHFAKHFNEKKKTKVDLYSNHRAMAKLLKEAKRVKRVLSANGAHTAQIEGLLDEEDFKLNVDRAQLEEMCSDMFDRVTKPIEDAMKASEITLNEISEVLLMGGGTRIPKVQELIQKFLGSTELGRSINTDEAAAMGAVYQAAYLGKGFKVLNFGVKEANIYPIVVEFEKHRDEESTAPLKVIKRTLFGRMNPYPQKKVMTFNKHFTDFSFNVSYGDMTEFMTETEVEEFKQLHDKIHNVDLKGVAEAYGKHTDAQETKGIKAHFKMDESGILHLDLVETVFEKEQKADESILSKLGDTISGLFGTTDDGGAKVEEGTEKTEGNNTAESSAGNDTVTETSKDKTEEPAKEETDSNKDKQKSEEPAQEEEKKEEKKEESEATGEKEEKTEEQTKEGEDSTAKDGEKKEEKEKTDKTDKDKKSDKKDDKTEEKEEAEKKPKIVVVKENITVDSVISDVLMPSKDSLKLSKKKLADLTAKDKEKKLLEKAKNELEAFTYEMGDKLTTDMYIECSTEEEREKYSAKLAEASDWLYEQEEDVTKEPFLAKLKELKKEVKDLEYRVREMKERPEALEALDSMLNQTDFFLGSIKNLSALEVAEDTIFTKIEVETLEKLINDTEDWKASMLKEQSEIAGSEKPKLLVEDIGAKIRALDREVKYLLNKAKTYKPKAKPKVSKNKTENANDTLSGKKSKKEKPIKEEGEPINTGDASSDTEETASPKPDVESEIPSPPVDEENTQTEETEQNKDDTKDEAETTTSKPTDKPVETNTHDASDL